MVRKSFEFSLFDIIFISTSYFYFLIRRFEDEMKCNPDLDDYVVQDITVDPFLPIADNYFDAVIVPANFQLLQRPLDMFKEINRVLKPGIVLINCLILFFLYIYMINFFQMSLCRRYCFCWGKTKLLGFFRLETRKILCRNKLLRRCVGFRFILSLCGGIHKARRI